MCNFSETQILNIPDLFEFVAFVKIGPLKRIYKLKNANCDIC